MTNDRNQHDQRMPEAARDALQRLYGGSAPENLQSQQFLLEVAEKRLCRRSFASHLNRRIGIAAAVGLVFVGGALTALWQTGQQPAVMQAALVGDTDGNGIVDVRDAFTVARAIDRDGPTLAAWDVVSDGVVDQWDVEFIMSLAVALPATAGQGEGGR